MYSFRQFLLARMGIAFWTDLRGELMVNLSKIFASFPADPRQKISELTETSIEHLLTQETSGCHPEVDVLGENHVCLVAEDMARKESGNSFEDD